MIAIYQSEHYSLVRMMNNNNSHNKTVGIELLIHMLVDYEVSTTTNYLNIRYTALPVRYDTQFLQGCTQCTIITKFKKNNNNNNRIEVSNGFPKLN